MKIVPFVVDRTLQEDNPGGVILSTDDYFYINGQYQFDVKYLGEAHEWNQNRGESGCAGLCVAVSAQKGEVFFSIHGFWETENFVYLCFVVLKHATQMCCR
jgi:hypothetical protein